jgi:large subunit ribosomal protein L24
MGVKIRKGDTVVVIAGDDKGTIDSPRVGRVLSVDEAKQRVTVEKVNMVKRHTKARRQGVQSGIVEKEAPIHLSNVMLYDPKARRGTRIKMRSLPDGSRERVSVVSDETLPKAGA